MQLLTGFEQRKRAIKYHLRVSFFVNFSLLSTLPHYCVARGSVFDGEDFFERFFFSFSALLRAPDEDRFLPFLYHWYFCFQSTALTLFALLIEVVVMMRCVFLFLFGYLDAVYW